MRTKSIIAVVWLASMLPVCSCTLPRAITGPAALPQAHAHNDYRHDRPLYDALEHGFTSVEADIYLVAGELYVAHDLREITPERKLRTLYLAPLRERIRQNNGQVYQGGAQFTLLIDIKSEAEATYKVLSKILSEYEDVFTTFDANVRRDKAVVAVVSGNCPRQLMESEPVRYAGYDGRLGDLGSDAPATLIPIISDNWRTHFNWNGVGSIPAEERKKLKYIVETAHLKGRRVRFWGTPDERSPAREAIWRELMSIGVDLINTDDLEGLQQFLLDYASR